MVTDAMYKALEREAQTREIEDAFASFYDTLDAKITERPWRHPNLEQAVHHLNRAKEEALKWLENQGKE